MASTDPSSAPHRFDASELAESAAALPPEECPLELEPPASLPAGQLDRWMLDPRITYLNHGSFGARLRTVNEAQAAHRRELEARPVAYLDRERDERSLDRRERVGRFLGMDPSCFGFVVNASDGINAVLRSLAWRSGDEILTTSHVYNAVRQTLGWLAATQDVVPIEASVELPVSGPRAIVDAITARLTDRTRMILVDHVTSESALVQPIEEIVRLARRRGIPVFVDGAHAPGMLDLDVTSVGADYYVGNLHKWVSAPLGSAFLHVAGATADGPPPVHPTVISHFHGEPMATEFAWQGTRDVSAYMTVPDAIRAMADVCPDAGWAGVRSHNNQLLAWAEDRLCRRWQVDPVAPAAMRGSMATIELPARLSKRFDAPSDLKRSVYDEDGIEVPFMEIAGRWYLRISAQVYNRPDDYERLADAIARRVT
ncbi:MAG: aminotransferase class V-fold PLP-dependent enzyme [Phycisphaerales bacterium]